MNFKYYVIDCDYMNYLRQIEPRIPKQDYYKFCNGQKLKLLKPFIGIVFVAPNGILYCTQISSPKNRHYLMNDDLDFKKYYIYDKSSNSMKLVGVINFNYMFPVSENALIELTPHNLCNYRSFASKSESSKYWHFLQIQLESINKNEWSNDIKNIYYKTNKTIAKRSFDFKTLENYSILWKKQKINV